MSDQATELQWSVSFCTSSRPHYLERVSIVLALRELRHRVKPGLILDVGCGMKPYKSLTSGPVLRHDRPITMEGSYGDRPGPTFFRQHGATIPRGYI